MNGKPKTQRAILLAAAHCKHPELDAGDKMLLMYLALNADFGTGANSHPGNRNIADAMSLTDRPTDARLAKNIVRGLIERTSRADGRGKASTYRLCLDSSYYPDETPGGEDLTAEARCVGSADTKPRCVGSAETETALCGTETALCDTGNRAVQEPKPRCADDKPRCAEAETALPEQPATISTHTSTSSPPANRPGMAGAAGWQEAGRVSPHQKTQEEKQRWLAFVNSAEADLPDSLRYAEPMPATRTKVLAQLDEIGSAENMGMAIGEWEQAQSPPLRTLEYGRWERWLETGSTTLMEWKA